MASNVFKIPSSTTVVTLVAPDAFLARKGCTIYNDSTANLYVKLGENCSTDDFTIKIAAGGYYEPPASSPYRDAITGLWDAVNGQARVTEYD